MATTWTIDGAHTDIGFSAKHMMVTTVRGTFDEVEGTLEIDEANPERSRAEIRVAVASLSTRNTQRDDHLRSPDFFDAATYPVLSVSATNVEARGDGRYSVTADVTIRGTTRSVVFDVEHRGFAVNFQGARHIALVARAMVNRKDWGLNWNMALEAGGVLVGEEVTLEIELAADEVASRELVGASA